MKKIILIAIACILGGLVAQAVTLSRVQIGAGFGSTQARVLNNVTTEIETELTTNAANIATLSAAGVGGTLAPDSLIVGNDTTNATAMAVTGDVTITQDGTNVTTAIASAVIVNADVNASAAIALTKLAAVEPTYVIVGDAASNAVAVVISGDVTIDNAGAVTIGAGTVDSAMLSTATQDQIAYLTVVGADLASAGTGTITIQLKDAATNDLAARALVRTWIGTADDFGADALTDYSVSTGVSKEEVTANAEYLAITDTNGVIVMAIDNGGAATNYVWAEVGGRIVASGELVLTAP